MHTVWFPHDAPPVRPGVYQRDYGDSEVPHDLGYCWFDGANWFAQCETPETAALERVRSLVPAPWRGLTLEEFVERHRDKSRALDRLIQDSKP